MTQETNTSKAIDFMHRFAATSRVDVSAFTDDATWWTLSGGDVPIKAHADQVSAVASVHFAGPGRFEIERVTAEADRVAIEARGFQPLKDGRSYDNLYLWLFSFNGAKICQVKAYFDTQRAARAFSPPGK